MIKIEFKEDFAGYKKGDSTEVKSTLAARLIRRGVAKVYKAKPKKAKSKKS